MKTLTHTTVIHAPASAVWAALVEPENYQTWASAFSPDSQFWGEWVEGQTVDFVDPNMGGTRALVECVEANKQLCVRHVAILGVDGTEDTSSDDATKWIGSTEEYSITEVDRVCHLLVITETDEAFVEMFTTCWPNALEKLKQLSEAER
ncbi:MAG: SRPBCC domain-containing protein [Verrucomicrobiota bacterium]